jgi:hypothetical protein
VKNQELAFEITWCAPKIRAQQMILTDAQYDLIHPACVEHNADCTFAIKFIKKKAPRAPPGAMATAPRAVGAPKKKLCWQVTVDIGNEQTVNEIGGQQFRRRADNGSSPPVLPGVIF